MKHLRIAVILFFISTYLYTEEKDDKNEETKKIISYTEKWTQIEGILRYRLEIADLNGQILFSKETENTELNIELLPGKFKKRLGLINKFNQLFLWTDWKEFEIKEIPEPKISYIEHKTLFPSEKEEKIQIAVDNITEKTKIYLEDSKTNTIKEIPYRQLDTNRIELIIDPSQQKIGKYNLIVRNSEKKQYRTTNAIEIKPLKKENIKALNWKLLIPGVPQRENKEYYKANFLQIGMLTSVAGMMYSYHNAIRWEEKYNLLSKNFFIYNFSGISRLPIFRSTLGIGINYFTIRKLQNYQSRHNSYAQAFLYSSILTGIFYSFHLLDVVKYGFSIEPQQKNVSLSIQISFDSIY
ncbi:MAG: hypothetical protein ACK4UJ_01050 [Leptonema sp. (in: bacteria)]